MTSRAAATQHLLDLAGLRRVRDRIDRDYAQPLDVQALARGVHLSAGHLSRQLKLAYGESPHAHLQATRRTWGVTTKPLNDKEADRCDAL